MRKGESLQEQEFIYQHIGCHLNKRIGLGRAKQKAQSTSDAETVSKMSRPRSHVQISASPEGINRLIFGVRTLLH
ncbi:hypothetical protein ANO14919_056820 [Xylariales sp. No.14919]|nr:hypothetical protein ANO14919_056820 [Xylariales sp. No.14919]